VIPACLAGFVALLELVLKLQQCSQDAAVLVEDWAAVRDEAWHSVHLLFALVMTMTAAAPKAAHK
jgi:hypothetical protein